MTLKNGLVAITGAVKRSLWVIGFSLLVAATGSFAQQNCNPTTPQLDPGTGFVAFGAREQLLARGGNQGPAWE